MERTEKRFARLLKLPCLISGPPTLVKQDVKVSLPQAMRERESALAVAAGRTNLSELARVNSENEARPGTQENDGKSSPLIPHPITRCDAESAQADSPHARGPSTNLSGLSGLRSEFHAHYELQKTVSKQILLMREAHPPISQGCRDSVRNSMPTMNFRRPSVPEKVKFHAHYELQKTVSARKSQIQVL